jgi:predicted ATP-dependent serine protease
MLLDVGRLSPAELGSGVATAWSRIGRKQELVRVLRAWDDVVGGCGRIVHLAGEPGVGKTRLAREAMARAVEHGASVLVGRSFEQQSCMQLRVPHRGLDRHATVCQAPDAQQRSRTHATGGTVWVG